MESTSSTMNSSVSRSIHSEEAEKRVWNSYDAGYTLGMGSYGEVIAATRDSDQRPVAIKFLDAKKVPFTFLFQGNKRRYPLEVIALDDARYIEGAVNLVEWVDCGDKIIIVMERPKNSVDLKVFLGSKESPQLKEEQAKTVMSQLVKTVDQLMSIGMIHRDLKAENILVDTESLEVKLIDFGLVDKVGSPGEIITTRVGTASHFPPELISLKQFSAGKGTVWAMGIILHQILMGYVPFDSIQEVLRGHFYTPPHVSSKCQDFLQRCLSHDANKRMSMSEMASHSWITSGESNGAAATGQSSNWNVFQLYPSIMTTNWTNVKMKGFGW